MRHEKKSAKFHKNLRSKQTVIYYKLTRNFNAKVSAGEGKAFIGVVDTYTENKSVHSLVTKI